MQEYRISGIVIACKLKEPPYREIPLGESKNRILGVFKVLRYKVMDKHPNLALIAQMIESAERSLASAKALLKESLGGKMPSTGPSAALRDLASSMSVSEGGKIIEGVFDGQNMIGPDNKQYPVPANYASKSKLIAGDVLKLTIAEDGSFIYKQIGPIERKKMIGMLLQDERGDFRVIAEGKTYKVLLASLTYFKAEPNDKVTIVVPVEAETEWAAVENVIKAGQHADSEFGSQEDYNSELENTVVRDVDDEL